MMLQKRRRRARLPAIDYETVENDARALLLANTRHGFHNRARYWRGDGVVAKSGRKPFQAVATAFIV